MQPGSSRVRPPSGPLDRYAGIRPALRRPGWRDGSSLLRSAGGGIVKSADAIVALSGEMGTLSEIALALKMGRPVISLGSWDIPGALKANSPEQAVEILKEIKG